MKDTEKLTEYIIKIVNFAKAIALDDENISADGIALTMAEEIKSYGAKALELLES